MNFLNRNKWVLSLYLCLICFYLIFHFFVVGKFSSYPWWHSHGSDGDGPFPATTLGLVNDTGFTLLMHPAATLYAVNGLTFRVLNQINPKYQKLMRLADVQSKMEIFDTIEIATRVSRIMALVTSLIFIIGLFFFMHKLTGGLGLLTALFIFYMISTGGFIIHSYWVRPEILSLTFLIAGFAIYLFKLNGKDNTFKQHIGFTILMGLCIGLAVFSKIQTGPAIVIFLAGLLAVQLFNAKQYQINTTQERVAKFCLIGMIINCLCFPWWILKRPAFITQEYLDSLYYKSNLRMVYGTAPDHFYFPIMVIFALLLSLTVLIVYLVKRKQLTSLVTKVLPNTAFLTFFISGLILSVYLVFAPISISFEKYIGNTHHLVYAMFTNIFAGAYLLQNVITFPEVLGRVYALHRGYSQILNVNILYLAGFAALLSLFRLSRTGTPAKNKYVIVLYFLITGIIMDIVSGYRPTVRHYIYNNYAIYSICFYTIGLAVCSALELSQLQRYKKGRAYSKALLTVIILFLTSHAAIMTHKMYTAPRASGISDQTPKVEYGHTVMECWHFWQLAEKNMRDRETTAAKQWWEHYKKTSYQH